MEVKKERKTSAWAIALKKWNSTRSCYSIPKKDSDEWKAVRALMGEAQGAAKAEVPKAQEAPKAQEPKEKFKKVTVKSEGRPASVPAAAPCATPVAVPTVVPKSKPKGVVKEQKLVLLTA